MKFTVKKIERDHLYQAFRSRQEVVKRQAALLRRIKHEASEAAICLSDDHHIEWAKDRINEITSRIDSYFDSFN